MKKERRPGGLLRIVDHHIEPGEPQRTGNRKDHRREPAEAFDLVQAPKIEEERRCNAEIDEIGERIEFGTKTRRPAERPRDAPVEPVEDRSREDGQYRAVVIAFRRNSDRGETERQRDQGHEIGHDDAKGDAPEPAAAPRRLQIVVDHIMHWLPLH